MQDRRRRIRTDARPEQRGLTFWSQWAAAIGLLILLLGVLTWLKTGTIGGGYRLLMVLTVMGSIPVYSLLRVYQKNLSYFAGLTRVLSAWLVLLGLLGAIAFITKTSDDYSREVLLLWTVLGALLQSVVFLLLHSVSRRYEAGLRKKRRAMIIGTRDSALLLAEKITRERGEPLVGLVASDEYDPEVDGRPIYPVLGKVANLRSLINEHQVTRLYIALPLKQAEQIEALYIDLLDMNVDVVWVPDLVDMVLLNQSVAEIAGMPAIHLNESPLTAYPSAILVKALIDRVLAFLALVAFSPLLITVALAIKLTSRGPVIFKQLRHGCNGQIIEVWKFRSMRMHQDKQVKQATREDPRITAVGRFIRRTSIDELPQFFNVLQGSMSLVGPRPHAVAHNDYYADKINAYMARHRIKPGITGLAQVSGCRGETETIEKMQKRVELDLAYINKWSVWLDIKILLKTPFTLFSKDIY